jgi:DNA mismatch repair protein MutS
MRADSGFTHRQTLAGAVRFNAPDLHEQAMRVAQAGAHALAAEAAHLEELTAAALARKSEIAATADALARLDVAAALDGASRAAGRAPISPIIPASRWKAAATPSSRPPSPRAAAASSPMTAAFLKTAASGSSPVPTWAANRPSCARMR